MQSQRFNLTFKSDFCQVIEPLIWIDTNYTILNGWDQRMHIFLYANILVKLWILQNPFAPRNQCRDESFVSNILLARPLWQPRGGGGALVFEVGYHPRKKIHVIRVVFQDQAYARTLFRGAKMCRIGEKRYVFGHIDIFWKGHDGQIKKNTCKNVYLGSIFIPEKYVFRVCFESSITRMISSLKYKWPPRLTASIPD